MPSDPDTLNTFSATREKRVLVVVRWPVGGIRTHIAYTYPTLTQAGYRFTFVLPDDSSLPTFAESLAHLPGCEFIGVPSDGKRCSMWSAVRRAVRERRYGLIHSHGLTAAVHTVLGNLGNGVPHLTTLHDVFREDQFVGWKGWLKKFLLARAVRRIDSVVSVGSDVKINLLHYLPSVGRLGGPRLPIIPNGIDIDHYQDDVRDTRPWLRERIGCDDDTVLLGFLGRFMEQKGFTHLLQALEILLRDGSPRPFHLVAVGSGDRRAGSQAEVSRRGLTGHVTMLDFTPDILPVLRQLDVLVMPSLWEASPLLPMEALSVGVPVLGSNCIGLREVLAGTPAHQFAAGDVNDLVRALRESLTNPRTEETREYADEARRRFDCRQSSGAFVEEYDRLFAGIGIEPVRRFVVDSGAIRISEGVSTVSTDTHLEVRR